MLVLFTCKNLQGDFKILFTSRFLLYWSIHKYVFKLSTQGLTQANILEHVISVLTFQVQLCREVGKSCENSSDFFLLKAEGSGRRGSCSALPMASSKKCEVGQSTCACSYFQYSP